MFESLCLTRKQQSWSVDFKVLLGARTDTDFLAVCRYCNKNLWAMVSGVKSRNCKLESNEVCEMPSYSWLNDLENKCNSLRKLNYDIPGWHFNPLTPKDPYSGRTAPLTSKRFILYIYSTNIGTEYFKHGIYSPFFFLKNAVCFIILKHLVPVLFTFYIQSVLKFKKNKSVAKRLIDRTHDVKVVIQYINTFLLSTGTETPWYLEQCCLNWEQIHVGFKRNK